MNQRSPIQPYLSNSLAVRQEIQRFESVHPSIYAIYDLIDAIPDPLIQQQIREHVVCIEGKISPGIVIIKKSMLVEKLMQNMNKIGSGCGYWESRGWFFQFYVEPLPIVHLQPIEPFATCCFHAPFKQFVISLGLPTDVE